MRSTLMSRIFSRFPRRFFATKNAAIVDNPYTGEIFCEVPYISSVTADRLIERSQKAQRDWANVSLDKRIQICEKFCAEMKKQEQLIAADITSMMGKPLKQALGEVGGLVDRTRALNDLAPNALADYIVPGSPKGFHRRISREPIGVVFVLAPWNYPLLTAVNGVVAAVLSGNSVLLKHSPRTPLVADHFQKAFEAAGAPEGLVTAFHVDHDEAARVIKKPQIGYVQFTGSVSGGSAVYKAVSERFIDAGLELGGKDAAYIREDANLDHAVDSTVDGAIYNAGQSCCAIERVYVHQSLYNSYVEKAKAILSSYRMGSPLKDTTNLGPMAQPNAINFLSQQCVEAKEKKAKIVLGGVPTKDSEGKGRFFPPTLITDCNHSMSVMTEESFGPILAVMSVKDDKEAIKYINDSRYGLTAAIYTTNDSQALAIGRRLSVGTVFMNRCDYLDPYLPWTGLRDSGKGASLSHLAFHAMTRLKGFNFKSLNV